MLRLKEYLATKDLNLKATTDNYIAYNDAEYVIISMPTNYDFEKNYFNTQTVEAVIANALANLSVCNNGYQVRLCRLDIRIYKRSLK